LSQVQIAAQVKRIRAFGKNEIIPARHSAAVIHPQFIQRKMNTRGTKTSREPGTRLCEQQQNKKRLVLPGFTFLRLLNPPPVAVLSLKILMVLQPAIRFHNLGRVSGGSENLGDQLVRIQRNRRN
jgi:hypothetical protein